MIRSIVLSVVLIPSFASAEMHLTEIYQSTLNCENASCVGEAASFCMETTEGGHSTFGAMDCILKEGDVWDERLNIAYQEARKFAQVMDEDDLEFFPEYAIRADQVLQAQRAWITYRDANCAMQHGLWGSGSMRQISGADCLLQMTALRTFELRDYVREMR